MSNNKKSKFSCCSLILWIFSAVIILISLFFWIAFPFIYKAIIHSMIKLVQNDDGQLSMITFLWSKPPLETLMKFYMFNVTNPDAIMYYGEKPAVVETGPFSFWEIEDKKYYQFNDDGSKVWYKNYKTYIFTKENSCELCEYDSVLSSPNYPAIGALEDLHSPEFNVSYFQQQFFALAIMLVGEVPFINVKTGELLFDGYNDAMLSAAHSEVAHLINELLQVESFIPVPVPEIKELAFFYHYNNTADEEYWVETGKDDVQRIGKIISWANRTELPAKWYSTSQTRMINGTDSGSLSRSNLRKDDKIEFFLSFLCRSFYLEFAEEVKINGVQTYEFQAPPSVFDTTLEEYRGMRYPNYEKVNYAKGWPNCPPKNQTAENCANVTVDCGVAQNLCHPCCNGSFVNGTYLMPPGLYPVQCYPGRLKDFPYLVQFSPPHFVYSPDELVNGVIGLRPDKIKHVPFSFKYEPTSGAPTEAKLQFMISTPFYDISDFAFLANMPQAIVPITWASAAGTLKEHTNDYMKLAFSTVPTIALALKISTIILGLLLALIGFVVHQKWQKNNKKLGDLRL